MKKNWFKGSVAMVLAALVVAAGATAVTANVVETNSLTASAISIHEFEIKNFKAVNPYGGAMKINSPVKFSAEMPDAMTNYGVYNFASIVVTKAGVEHANLNFNLGSQRQDTWYPTESGTYTAKLNVVDYYGNYGSKTITFNVQAGAGYVDIRNFKAANANGGTMKVGSKVKFSADILNATTGYGVYTSANIKVTKDGVEHANLNYNLGSQREDTWFPTEAGTYTAKLTVVDWNGKYAASTINFNVANLDDVNITSFSANSVYGGKLRVGSTIRFDYYFQNAQTNYGVYTSANILVMKDGVEHANLDINLNKNQNTWTPSEAGRYTAKLTLLDYYGKYAVRTIAFDVARRDGDVSVDSFSAYTPSGKFCAKAPIKFSYSVSDAMTNYGVYTCANIVITKDGVQQANIDVNLNTNPDKWTFTPKTAGKYIAKFGITDYYGHYAVKSIAFDVTDALVSTASLSKSKVTLTQPVSVYAAGTKGAGSYQYQYSYKLTSEKSWTTFKTYSTVNNATFTPGVAGTYQVRVQTKDANGTVSSTSKLLTVQAALKNNSKVSATTIAPKKAVTVTGAATGGSGAGTYKYAFAYKLSTASSYTTLRSYNAKNTYSLMLTTAGKYYVRVQVKDSNGKVVSKVMTVTVK